MLEQNLLNRITRDIADGLMVLDLHGNIVFANPAAETLLGVDGLTEGQKYVEFMMNDRGSANDDFHQFLLDAVYDKENTHRGELTYICPDGRKRVFNMSSSFVFDEDKGSEEGVVIQFSDVTRVAFLRQKIRDSARIFIVMLAGLCLWVFLYAIWELLGRPVSDTVMTKAVEVMGFVIFFYILKKTSIGFEDMGLRFKGAGRAVLVDGAATALILALMLAAKALIRRLNPAAFGGPDAPFFFWNRFDWADAIYPLTVVVQEFLTRGVMHESIRRIIPGKYAKLIAILVSSLFFGALHIHKGLAYMVGSVLLLGVFGLIYRRQRTIWGLCIPHYFLGMALKFIFGF